MRQILAGKRNNGGSRQPERTEVCCRCLSAVRRTENICVRFCAEHIQLFYRLMRGTVFSDAYAVMCHNVKHTLLHQCGKTHCGLKVIGKNKESCTERHQTAVKRNAVADCCHSKFTNTKVDILPLRCFSAEKLESFQFCIVGRCKIRTAAEHGREILHKSVEHSTGAGPCRCFFVFELKNAIIVIKFFRQFCGVPAEQLGIEFRVTTLIFCNHRIVGIFTLAIICRKVGKIVINLGRHGERFIIPTDGFFPFGNILFAQR